MDEIRVRIPDEFNPSDMPVARSQFLGEGYDWGGMMLYIDRVHALGLTGKGISIGIIDTGFYPGHPDLDDECLHRNFTKDPDDTDLSGHSTHVRGIMGMKSNGKGLIGIMPDAKYHSAKALGGRSGTGTAKMCIEAYRWMIEEVKPDFINMSLAFDSEVPELSKLINQAFDMGIGTVAASGNFSEKKVSFPASHPKAMAVGASDQHDDLCFFSNTGAFLDQLSVVAPGLNIRSTWIDGNYRHSDGTSMAAPHVTALCGLTKQRLKELGKPCDPATVRMLVEGFAKDLGAKGKDLKFGNGRITTDWFAVDTVEDDLERCKELDCMKDKSGNMGCGLIPAIIAYFLSL